MPVRGKILNTQKATIDQIQKNAEIMNMIDAFGLEVKDGKIIASAYNKRENSFDATAHAEILAIKKAGLKGLLKYIIILQQLQLLFEATY
mgnify:CR=1 FL=1